MSNNRITPFVKRMRTTGGTIYTFSSAVEDIGLNINERNNVVKISHFALLNIPKINEPDNISENRFNVLAIPGAFEYWKTGGSIKDGRVIVAESFQNYALNLEANLLNQSSYDSALSRTVSERVFWKWMKETGAIRWANPSNGYWMETEDADGDIGYNTVVKYFGLVSAGNVRQDSFGTYNETYILVPTSHGQMEPYFEQIEDTNYKHGMQIGDLGENILGRDGWTKPHPDGLSFSGYYDYVDSSTKVWDLGSYNMTVNGNPGGWYTAEGITPANENTYLTDTSAYILSGDYDASIKYQSGGDNIEFKRSNVDCLGLVLDIKKLQTIYGDSTLTFDKLASDSNLVVNDTFEFNAVMIYYSIYNSVQDTILATNLLGILFLDAPSGNTQVIGDGALGILLPSLEKIQSGPSGFGTSYNLRLNIKSDNMVDDTAAIIVDAATSDQLAGADWSQAFYELGKAVNILTQNNSVINYISGQYTQVQNAQTQMQNELNQLEFVVNDISKDIQGTENTIALFSAGDDPLVDSSIYMKNGNIGFFNNAPEWPVQIDASLKVKDIYIEKAIKDASGNSLLSWGSPLNLGSSTIFREMAFYTGNLIPAITIDTSNNITFNGSTNISGGGGTSDVTKLYVDGSLFIRDASITDLYSKIGGATTAYVDVADNSIKSLYIPDTSLNHTQFIWGKTSVGILDVSVAGGGGGDVTTAQLAARDVSIAWLNANKQPLGNYATPLYVTTSLLPYATNASIGLAGFAKAANYLPLTGGLINGGVGIIGDFAANGTIINFNSAPQIVTSNVDITAHGTTPITDMNGMSITFVPKSTQAFVMFSAPFHSNITGRAFDLYIYVNGINVRHAHAAIYQQDMNVAFQHIITNLIPGVSVLIKIRWTGDTAIHQSDSASDSERILTVFDLF